MARIVDMLVALVNAQEEDSARIARLLHDEVGQVLSAAGLQLGVLRLDFKDQSPPDLGPRITEIQNMLEQAIDRVREVSYELNPQVVERAGLHSALDRLIARHRRTFSGSLRLAFDPSVRMPEPAAAATYKIAEHALENAVRHSHAASVDVIVRPGRGGEVLEVRDNGRGFAVAAVRRAGNGLGLLLMQHFASQAGLALHVRSTSGKGTIVKVHHPAPHPGPSEG